MDMEKVKAELDEIVEQCRGMNYIGFSTITEHCQNILAMLKEQEHKDKMFHALEEDWKRLKALLKEQEKHSHELQQIINDGFEAMKVATKRIKELESLLKEQEERGRAKIKEPDCRICGQSHCKYYHESQKPTECKSYIRNESR